MENDLPVTTDDKELSRIKNWVTAISKRSAINEPTINSDESIVVKVIKASEKKDDLSKGVKL